MSSKVVLEPITVLHNKKVWLTADGRLEVYDYRLATKLNKYLKVYDGGKYRFRSGEEGLFKISHDDIEHILKTFLIKKPKTLKSSIVKNSGVA